MVRYQNINQTSADRYSSGDNNNNGCAWRDTLPSARTISHHFHTDFNVPSTDVTHMVTQWGQFLDHDVTATPELEETEHCCDHKDAEDCLVIDIRKDDSFYSNFSKTCMSFHRYVLL